MGAIKEGEDPEDYYIEHNKPLAFASIGTLTIIGLIAAVVVVQNKMENPSKPTIKLPIKQTKRKPLFGKKKKPLLLGGRKR